MILYDENVFFIFLKFIYLGFMEEAIQEKRERVFEEKKEKIGIIWFEILSGKEGWKISQKLK